MTRRIDRYRIIPPDNVAGAGGALSIAWRQSIVVRRPAIVDTRAARDGRDVEPIERPEQRVQIDQVEAWPRARRDTLSGGDAAGENDARQAGNVRAMRLPCDDEAAHLHRLAVMADAAQE